MCISQESANCTSPWIILDTELWSINLIYTSQFVLQFISTGQHGPEFQTVKVLTVQPLTFVFEKDRTRGVKYYCQSNKRRYWCKQDEHDNSDNEVNNSFKTSRVGELRPDSKVVYAGIIAIYHGVFIRE